MGLFSDSRRRLNSTNSGGVLTAPVVAEATCAGPLSSAATGYRQSSGSPLFEAVGLVSFEEPTVVRSDAYFNQRGLHTSLGVTVRAIVA
jgi:hypothetical protein